MENILLKFCFCIFHKIRIQVFLKSALNTNAVEMFIHLCNAIIGSLNYFELNIITSTISKMIEHLNQELPEYLTIAQIMVFQNVSTCVACVDYKVFQYVSACVVCVDSRFFEYVSLTYCMCEPISIMGVTFRNIGKGLLIRA